MLLKKQFFTRKVKAESERLDPFHLLAFPKTTDFIRPCKRRWRARLAYKPSISQTRALSALLTSLLAAR